MTEIEAIRARHSVRAYQNRAIEPEKLARLRALADEANEDGSVSFSDKGGPFSGVDLGIVKYHFTAGAEFIKNGGTET